MLNHTIPFTEWDWLIFIGGYDNESNYFTEADLSQDPPEVYPIQLELFELEDVPF
jgi:hypothetical protein